MEANMNITFKVLWKKNVEWENKLRKWNRGKPGSETEMFLFDNVHNLYQSPEPMQEIVS